MPIARILLVLIFARAKLDTVEMGKHAKVDKRTVLLDDKVRNNVVETSEPTSWLSRSKLQSLATSKNRTFIDTVFLLITASYSGCNNYHALCYHETTHD